MTQDEDCIVISNGVGRTKAPGTPNSIQIIAQFPFFPTQSVVSIDRRVSLEEIREDTESHEWPRHITHDTHQVDQSLIPVIRHWDVHQRRFKIKIISKFCLKQPCKKYDVDSHGNSMSRQFLVTTRFGGSLVQIHTKFHDFCMSFIQVLFVFHA